MDQLREQGYSNMLQSRFGDKTFLFAVKDSVEVDLASMASHELIRWSLENNASIRVFETNARGRITRELNRRDVSEIPIEGEAQVQAETLPVRTEERLRLGRDTNARTRQIVRAFESGNYEGITFPATGGARAEFFQQFSESEREFLQRAWGFASTDERKLFAAELDAFFAEAGNGRMGMLTLAKILQRMVSDYLSHDGAYMYSRLFSITDIYYYASRSDMMADEKTVGGAREHSIGSIARAMRGSVGRRYDRLIERMGEERRSAIIRSVPGLEEAPVPEAAEAVAPEPEVAQAPRPALSDTDRMLVEHSQVVFYNELLERLPEGQPGRAELLASLRAAEDRFIAYLQNQPGEIQDAAAGLVQGIMDRRAAEQAAPLETVPTPQPVQAEVVEAPARIEAVPTREAVYDYAWAVEQRRRMDRREIRSPAEARAILRGIEEVLEGDVSPDRTRFLFSLRADLNRMLAPRAAPVPPAVAERAPPAVAEAPPVAEEAAPAVEATPAAREAQAYNIAWAEDMMRQILELSGGMNLDDPTILSIRGMEPLYREFYAHIDEAIANTPDATNREKLERVRDSILKPVLG